MWYCIQLCRDGNFETLIAGGYQDDWVDMNEYFKSRYPEKHAEAPRRMEVITNKTFELSKDFIRDKFHSQAPPKKRFILSRFQNVPKRIDNYNYTELNRAPPYHKPHGCGGRHAPPPGGIYKIWISTISTTTTIEGFLDLYRHWAKTYPHPKTTTNGGPNCAADEIRFF